MKRIILFLLCLISIFTITNTNVYAEEWGRVSFSFNTLKHGNDSYRFETNFVGGYRLIKNDRQYYYFNIDENSSLRENIYHFGDEHIYLFGSIFNFLDEERSNSRSRPYCLRIKYDLSEYEIFIIDDCIYDSKYISQVSDIVEGINNDVFMTISLNALFTDDYRYGTQKVIRTSDFKTIDKEIEFETKILTIKSEYNDLIIFDTVNYYYYNYDLSQIKNINISETYYGHFELMKDTYVNGELMNRHQVISNPGIYTLEDTTGFKGSKTITLIPKLNINGDIINDCYKEYFSYKCSGGKLYINNRASSLNGTISSPGIYVFKVKGLDDYVYEETFKIAPEVYSTISGSDMNVGDSIIFTGKGKLNDKEIYSGYIIDEEGSYTLDLYLGDEIVKSYSFIVTKQVVTVNEKENLKNILLILLVVLIFILVMYVLINIFKTIKKKPKEEKL